MKSRHARLSLLISMLVALALNAPPVAPASIEVNATCTLVDAINAANDDDDGGGLCPPGGSGPDTLELSGNVLLTTVNNYDSQFEEPTGLPEVTTNITVEGGGFTIERAEGAPDFRILFVAASGTLALNDVTVRNGGGDVYFGGGITALGGPLVLTNSTVTANTATTVEGFGRGGGILAYGPTTLTNSTVSNNETGWFAGGLVVSNVLTMSYSTVSGNYAGYAIGGILLTTTVGESTLTNTTVSGNSAGGNRGRWGGGLTIQGTAPTTMTNVTISGNSNPADGGILYVSNDSVTLSNSVVADSPGSVNCMSRAGVVLIDGGNNFDDDGSCPSALPITPGVDFDATLADNGGPTMTHALLEGSVAIDAVGQCPLEFDQRGYRRDDGACDTGAFESGAVACTTCVAPELLVGLLSDLRLAKSCREATCHDPDSLLPLNYLCTLGMPDPGDGYYYLD